MSVANWLGVPQIPWAGLGQWDQLDEMLVDWALWKATSGIHSCHRGYHWPHPPERIIQINYIIRYQKVLVVERLLIAMTYCGTFGVRAAVSILKGYISLCALCCAREKVDQGQWPIVYPTSNSGFLLGELRSWHVSALYWPPFNPLSDRSISAVWGKWDNTNFEFVCMLHVLVLQWCIFLILLSWKVWNPRLKIVGARKGSIISSGLLDKKRFQLSFLTCQAWKSRPWHFRLMPRSCCCPGVSRYSCSYLRCSFRFRTSNYLQKKFVHNYLI